MNIHTMVYHLWRMCAFVWLCVGNLCIMGFECNYYADIFLCNLMECTTVILFYECESIWHLFRWCFGWEWIASFCCTNWCHLVWILCCSLSSVVGESVVGVRSAFGVIKWLAFCQQLWSLTWPCSGTESWICMKALVSKG
jgi:hypothetical protein